MKQTSVPSPAAQKRKYVPVSLEINAWSVLQPFYEDLQNRTIASGKEFGQWLNDQSELSAVISEDMAWRYIRNSCDTVNPDYKAAYEFFVTEIQPNIAPYDDALNKKLLSSPYLDEFLNGLPLETRTAYGIYIRSIRKQVEIYREENIPLMTWLHTEENKYAEIIGAMTIEMEGKEITLQQASNYLRDSRREVREEVYYKVNKRRAQDREKLDDLFSSLVKKRHQVALNAGFDNYRDYMFAALGRFDYTVQDCFNFHQAIAKEIVPICNTIDAERKTALKLDQLKPWDMEVDISGKPPLKPFDGGEDLMNKTIECFSKLNPYLGQCMTTMREMQHVDLDSRIGKAPGGYNYPLYETGVPFIFMNSVNSLRDLVTMVHEGGHAVHSFLTQDKEFMAFKDTPSEVAELASMSMELISMDHWNVFFSDSDELKRARTQQLEKVISTLPWIAAIDKFQHWLYTNPDHTAEQRTAEWTSINKEFTGNVTDYHGQEEFFGNSWQRQLHLFQVPFYYIEYGMAQLGAIAMWRNFKKDSTQGLHNYMEALKLGYTKSIGDIYQQGGIRFDFSQPYIQELAGFVKNEMQKLN